MNAKFEKWYYQSPGAETPKQLASDAWQAAIKSLEVTPELEDVFKDAFDDVYDGDNMRMANSYALQQVLSSLKEQAK